MKFQRKEVHGDSKRSDQKNKEKIKGMRLVVGYMDARYREVRGKQHDARDVA